MDKAERKHCLQQARDHQRMAVRERELAEKARLVGAVDQAQRHLLDATLHEKRAEAYAGQLASQIARRSRWRRPRRTGG